MPHTGMVNTTGNKLHGYGEYYWKTAVPMWVTRKKARCMGVDILCRMIASSTKESTRMALGVASARLSTIEAVTTTKAMG